MKQYKYIYTYYFRVYIHTPIQRASSDLSLLRTRCLHFLIHRRTRLLPICTTKQRDMALVDDNHTATMLLASAANAVTRSQRALHGQLPYIHGQTRANAVQAMVHACMAHHSEPCPSPSSIPHASSALRETAQATIAPHSQLAYVMDYCCDVEQYIYLLHGHSATLYQRKISQLAYNLSLNAATIIQQYTPDQLVVLDSTTLARGTVVERNQHEYLARVEECRRALDINGLLKEYEAGVAMETCPKCKGSQLTYNAVQDRSADEGQSVYFYCLNANCKHSWRIRT